MDSRIPKRSVIIGLHHQQDIRAMGGLKKIMPVTFITAWVGTLALMGFPGFSGFYSKDAILSAVGHIERAGASLAEVLLVAGVIVTALYSFRLMYLVFHADTRMDEKTREHAHESPWVVTVPLVMLAVPSVVIGWWAAEPLLFGGYFGEAILILPEHDSLAHMREQWHGAGAFALHGLQTLPVWLATGGAAPMIDRLSTVRPWLFLVAVTPKAPIGVKVSSPAIVGHPVGSPPPGATVRISS